MLKKFLIFAIFYQFLFTHFQNPPIASYSIAETTSSHKESDVSDDVRQLLNHFENISYCYLLLIYLLSFYLRLTLCLMRKITLVMMN